MVWRPRTVHDVRMALRGLHAPAAREPRSDQRVQRGPGVRDRRSPHRFPGTHRDDRGDRAKLDRAVVRRAPAAADAIDSARIRDPAQPRIARGRAQHRCGLGVHPLGAQPRRLIRLAAIRALPDLLVNQIAAGEVVERPAAALKELIENSIDAGAKQIDIDTAAGGVKRLRVADDGDGIDREDLALAVSRHATSKIAVPSDLEAIATLGFRGEALASIAAVSRLSLASRAAGKPHAWRLEVEGGTLQPLMPAALASGTSVTVEELFFNTPARRKFLRTEATEWAHCDETFRRVALAHPEVGFTLHHNGRAQQRLLPGGRKSRVEALLGTAFIANAASVGADAGDVQIGRASCGKEG